MTDEGSIDPGSGVHGQYFGGGIYGGITCINESFFNFPWFQASIRRSISEPMWHISCQVEKTALVPPYFTTIDLIQEDAESEYRCIFLGVIPKLSYSYADCADQTTVDGYSHEWYLTHQFLDYSPSLIQSRIKATVPPEEPDYENPADFIKKLLFDYTYTSDTLNPVYTTRKAGIYINNAQDSIRQVPNWTTPTGALTDVTKTRIVRKQFIFDSKTTKQQAIEEICEYCNMLFFVKWEQISDAFVPVAYFVHEDDVDLYLNLPSPLTLHLNGTSQGVLPQVNIVADQAGMYNSITVAGVDATTGTWYYATRKTADVYLYESSDGLRGTPPIEYRFESTDLSSQALVDARADELYDFFTTPNSVYTIPIQGRWDLELYQKIKFIGIEGVPDDEYLRIIEIEHVLDQAGMNDTTTVICTEDTRWSLARRLSSLMGNQFQMEQAKIQENFFVDLTKISIGTILTVNGGDVVATLDKGGQIHCRVLNA